MDRMKSESNELQVFVENGLSKLRINTDDYKHNSNPSLISTESSSSAIVDTNKWPLSFGKQEKFPEKERSSSCAQLESTFFSALNGYLGNDKSTTVINGKYQYVLPSFENLETPFKWLRELEGEPVDTDRVETLLRRILEWSEESEAVELSCPAIAFQNFCIATYYASLGNYKEALASITRISGISKTWSEVDPEYGRSLQPEEHMKVYEYISESLEAIILHRRGDLKRATQLLDKIRGYDVSHDHCKALLLHLKSQFAGQVGNIDAKVLLCQKVITFNDTNDEFYHSLHTALRGQRRVKNVACKPSEEENYAAHKAYDLSKLSPTNLFGLVSLYNEILLSCKASNCKLSLAERQTLSKKIIEYSKLALNLNPNSVSTTVKVAEIFSFGNIEREYLDEAVSERMFKNCEILWPNNTNVLHKFGKFHMRRTNRDTNKGQEYFVRALEADSSNFPCLMDYMKNMFVNKSNDKAITTIEKYLPVYRHSKVQYSKLLAMQGVLCIRSQEYNVAIKCFTKALNNENVTEIVDFLCWLPHLLRCSTNAEKIEELIGTLRDSPSNPEAWHGVNPESPEFNLIDKFLNDLLQWHHRKRESQSSQKENFRWGSENSGHNTGEMENARRSAHRENGASKRTHPAHLLNGGISGRYGYNETNTGQSANHENGTVGRSYRRDDRNGTTRHSANYGGNTGRFDDRYLERTHYRNDRNDGRSYSSHEKRLSTNRGRNEQDFDNRNRYPNSGLRCDFDTNWRR